MQSQLQTVINNSLSSSIALTGILPQMKSTDVTTDRNGNKDGGHRSKEGYSRQDIRVVNKNTRSSNQQRIVAFEPGNDMFVKYLY